MSSSDLRWQYTGPDALARLKLVIAKGSGLGNVVTLICESSSVGALVIALHPICPRHQSSGLGSLLIAVFVKTPNTLRGPSFLLCEQIRTTRGRSGRAFYV